MFPCYPFLFAFITVVSIISVVWDLSAVCSWAVNPFNAGFHSALFKPAAYTLTLDTLT